MKTEEDLAIVLKSVAFEERHRIVTGLTARFGKISVVARNAIQSRRFGGALEVFAAAEWRVVIKENAELWRLEQATIRRAYEGLRGDFAKLSLASVFNELMLRVAPDREPCPELFKLHANALALVEEASAEAVSGHGPLLNAYLAKILQWSGNQPQLQACQGCGKKLETLDPESEVTGIVESAMWRCSNCIGANAIQGRKLSAWALVDLYSSLLLPIRESVLQARADRAQHEALFVFLEAVLNYHVPGLDRSELKSLRFLKP